MFSSLSVCLSVCLLATFRKIFERICIKFSGKVGNGAMNKYLILVEIWITIWMQGLFSVFVTIGRYGKLYQPSALRDAAVHGMH